MRKPGRPKKKDIKKNWSIRITDANKRKVLSRYGSVQGFFDYALIKLMD